MPTLARYLPKLLEYQINLSIPLPVEVAGSCRPHGSHPWILLSWTVKLKGLPTASISFLFKGGGTITAPNTAVTLTIN